MYNSYNNNLHVSVDVELSERVRCKYVYKLENAIRSYSTITDELSKLVARFFNVLN